MTTKEAILKLFETFQELSVKELVERLNVSKQMVHIALNRLMDENKVEKLGRAPKTIYRLKTEAPMDREKPIEITPQERSFLKENFLVVTEIGELLEGVDAFSHWCKQRTLPMKKTLSEFIETKEKYIPFCDQYGLINGMDKMRSTKGYERIGLDGLYYLDFYAIERFGKTRLGTLLHYAKQGQNKFLMQIMMKETGEKIKSFIQRAGADAIAYVPPTIRRDVQIMKFIQNYLRIALPVIDIKKMSGIIPVPQKSLSKLPERIRNADNTFAVTEQRKFKTIVLIDDAVGSGSTMNQISIKIKDKEIADRVIGLAMVGSFKGFDVITDV